MCGILASIRFHGVVNLERFAGALDSMVHRGPDGSGIWSSPDYTVALGHRRLSIVGGEGGAQPIKSKTGLQVAIVNGEFYNFSQLYRSLKYYETTTSDSEALLPIYKKLGLAGISRLRGEFSFVLWDEDRGLLVAGRDRFGVKPLYYALDGDGVLFSSEIKSLIACGAHAGWNPSAVHGSERMLYPVHEACFSGISQVRPGTVMTFGRDGSIEIYPYSEPLERKREAASRTLDEEVSLFKSAFDDAVGIRLSDDPRAICYLSGGIDSCSILGTAAQISGRAPESFTVRFEDGSYSELAQASLQAKFCGSKLNVVEVSELDIVDNFEKAIRAFEMPFGNTHGVAKMILSEAVSAAGFRIALTGEGADELLGGYPHFQEDALMASNSPTEPGAAVGLNNTYADFEKFPGFLLRGEIESDLTRFASRWGYVPAMLRTGSSRGALFSKLYSDSFNGFHEDARPYSDLLKHVDVELNQNLDVLHRSMVLWQKTVLPGYILTALGDRAEMANSVEARLPFLDQELHAVVHSLSTEAKFNRHEGKVVLRRAMSGRVHPDIIVGRKSPFMSPPVNRSGKSNAMKNYMGDVFSSSMLDDQEFYCPTKVRRLFASIGGMDCREFMQVDRILTFVLSVCVMNKVFLLRRGGA